MAATLAWSPPAKVSSNAKELGRFSSCKAARRVAKASILTVQLVRPEAESRIRSRGTRCKWRDSAALSPPDFTTRCTRGQLATTSCTRGHLAERAVQGEERGRLRGQGVGQRGRQGVRAAAGRQQAGPRGPKGRNGEAASERNDSSEGSRSRPQEADSDDADSDVLDASLPLPSPPAGFVLNERGEVQLMAAEEKRVITIFDESGRQLECVIRRAFLDTRGWPFFLLYPLDTPIMIYRISPKNGALAEISDDELNRVFADASYALAKKSLHLMRTGFALTLRGAICFSEDDVIDLDTEYGFSIGGSLSQGVDITTFSVGSADYLIYAPFDPLMFIAYKDRDTGAVKVAEEQSLLEDPKVVEAIAEEEDYQRMVEAEDEMKELLSGKLR